MPVANVRGANINYEVLGTHGPWVALSPGGRRALDNVRNLARHVADRGYRVLIHDRRNCGVSDIVIGGDKSEYEVWADDLHALLSQHNALPAIVGGGSSGCRLSVLFALTYPQDVSALLLRSEEHTSELQSLRHLVCRLLLEKKKQQTKRQTE